MIHLISLASSVPAPLTEYIICSAKYSEGENIEYNITVSNFLTFPSNSLEITSTIFFLYFLRYSLQTKSNSAGDNSVKYLMKVIDGVEYAGNNCFYSKYGGVALHVSELSTGCKTAINVYSCPDKIFDIGECGNNALAAICNLKRGNIYTDEFVNTDTFNNTVRVVCKNKGIDCVVNNDMELRTLLFNIT